MLFDPERLVEEWESDRYHELFSWAPLGYARLTFDGRICELNYTGADLLEVTIGSIVGQPLTAYVVRSDRTSFLDHLARARHSRETIEDDIQFRSAGGHHFPVRLCTRRSPKREQHVCWTLFADLSEYHRLHDVGHRPDVVQRPTPVERRIERLDADTKGRFVAALSHELRTPLAPVLMATSMLSSLEGLPTPAATIIETIRRNVQREARLIDQLLEQIASADTVAADQTQPAPESGPAADADLTKHASRAASLRILVVEDHADSGAMLDLLLSSRGHRVAVANSVAAALSRRDESWDVVISDLGLPDGSGLDVGRMMRALPEPPCLIALSGYGRPSDVMASHDAGFDHHLVKPLEPDRLFEILETRC